MVFVTDICVRCFTPFSLYQMASAVDTKRTRKEKTQETPVKDDKHALYSITEKGKEFCANFKSSLSPIALPSTGPLCKDPLAEQAKVKTPEKEETEPVRAKYPIAAWYTYRLLSCLKTESKTAGQLACLCKRTPTTPVTSKRKTKTTITQFKIVHSESLRILNICAKEGYVTKSL